MRSTWKYIFCFSAFVSGFGAGCAPIESTSSQLADSDWSPIVSDPLFPEDSGPAILVDAAHGNFHTMEGRYAAFAELLGLDGYRVRSAHESVSSELLRQADVFVIANALHGGQDADWVLPTPPAFQTEEIQAIVDWVEQGGSLLLIADHMPFPGATADLAAAFGIVFLNGYAMSPDGGGGTMSFTRASGALADHAIARGRSGSEAVESVRSFTGQAFRSVGPVQPIMRMPDDWVVLLPIEAGVFDDTTPRVSARGLLQGGTLRFGSGRVAVFGEAAMFTAQTWVRDGMVGQMGMNHPSATENAQFVLNVMHWLTGALGE
jgi:hypothetical protein